MTTSIVTEGAQPNYGPVAQSHAQKINNYLAGRGVFDEATYKGLAETSKPTEPVAKECCHMNTVEIVNNNNIIITTFITTKDQY